LPDGRSFGPTTPGRKGRAMETEELKKVIVDTLTKKLKTKSKFYLKDFYAMAPDMKARAVKKSRQ
jgi:hypothetical protein